VSQTATVPAKKTRSVSLLPARRLLYAVVALGVLSIALIPWPNLQLVLLAADLLLLLLILTDWLITPAPGVLSVKRHMPERLSLLREQTVILEIRNTASVSIWVRIRDTLPTSLHAAGSTTCATTVSARGLARCEYTVKPAKRGQYFLGELHLRYQSLLGFWERAKIVPATQEVRILPSVADIERYHLLASVNRLDMLGIRPVRMRGSSEFESLRDYNIGDDTRLLDWKATARRGKLIVRNQQVERNQTIIILVDSGRLMNAEENGVSKLDYAVNAALLLAHVGLSRGDRVGLCTFSAKPKEWVTPRASLKQLRLITEALYDLQGDFTESNHGRCVETVSARFNKRALLVVLTDFVDAATARDMVAHLQRAGRKYLVLFAALQDQYLLDPASGHATKAIDGFRQATALDLLHERRTVLEQLRHHGAVVADVPPQRLSPELLNKYLEVTFRGML
jgi:uncharacterized protein (DUF58 family)